MSNWTIAKETVAELSEQAPEHGADAAGMLEALISPATGALAAEQGAAYANFSSTTKSAQSTSSTWIYKGSLESRVTHFHELC
jgi:hypothetical protein